MYFTLLSSPRLESNPPKLSHLKAEDLNLISQRWKIIYVEDGGLEGQTHLIAHISVLSASKHPTVYKTPSESNPAL